MAWTDVCRRGRWVGGKVRQDDVHKSDPPSDHDAGEESPGIRNFITDVVRNDPPWRYPEKPSDFPTGCLVQTYPGKSASDVHFEGRAADVFLDYTNPTERAWGDWLFDWCVENCKLYSIQGVIFGKRQWFSEMNHGEEFPRTQGDHNNHVHVELNCDGAQGI